MKLVVLLVIGAVTLLHNPTLCQGRNLERGRSSEIVAASAASSDGSLIRRTRGLPDFIITDSKIKEQEEIGRKNEIRKLLNNTATFKDCAQCFQALSSKMNCVCDATEIVMHIHERKKKGLTTQLKNLNFRLRQQVMKRLVELVRQQRKRMRKYLVNKKNPHKFLLGWINRKKKSRSNIVNNMIIF